MFTWFINEASADINSVHICIFNTPPFDIHRMNFHDHFGCHEGNDNNIFAQKLNHNRTFFNPRSLLHIMYSAL